MKICAYRFFSSLSLSLFLFGPYLSWCVDLEIPITAIQIPPLIIFRHTRLFTLFFPQAATDIFHPPHGAEEVPTGEVGEIVFGPTAFDEFGELSMKHPARGGAEGGGRGGGRGFVSVSGRRGKKGREGRGAYEVRILGYIFKTLGHGFNPIVIGSDPNTKPKKVSPRKTSQALKKSKILFMD